VLLDRLGVSADAPATAPAAAPAPVVAPAQVAAASAAAQAAPAGAQKPAGVGDGGSGAGLYLSGLGGLLTGAALVLVPQRYRQRRWALDSATPTSEDPSELEYEPLDPRSP